MIAQTLKRFASVALAGTGVLTVNLDQAAAQSDWRVELQPAGMNAVTFGVHPDATDAYDPLLEEYRPAVIAVYPPPPVAYFVTADGSPVVSDLRSGAADTLHQLLLVIETTSVTGTAAVAFTWDWARVAAATTFATLEGVDLRSTGSASVLFSAQTPPQHLYPPDLGRLFARLAFRSTAGFAGFHTALTVDQQPLAAVGGRVLVPPLAISARQGDRRVTGVPVTVSLASGTGALAGTTTRATAGGPGGAVAVFDDLIYTAASASDTFVLEASSLDFEGNPVAAATAPVAAGPLPPCDADPRHVDLPVGEPQTLTWATSTAVTLQATAVRDSRCPLGVLCVWAGEVSVDLDVRVGDGALQAHTLTLRTAGAEDASTAMAADFRIALVGVLPYPVFGLPPDPAGYVARVEVAPVASAPVFALPRLAGPPVIDGVRDPQEWQGALPLEVSPSQVLRDRQLLCAGDGVDPVERSRIELRRGPAEDAFAALTDADWSATLWHAWDETGLYFLAEVRDNVRDVAGLDGAPDWRHRDGLTLRLDLLDAEAVAPEGSGPALTALHLVAADPLQADQPVSWEVDGELTVADPAGLQGIQYAFAHAGSAFGGGADYVVEARIDWTLLLLRDLPTPPGPGTRIGLAWLGLDPDGEDGFGGQLQAWGLAEEPATYASFVLQDAAAVEPAPSSQVTITVSSTGPGESEPLRLGFQPGATAGLDEALGEVERPPLPPAGVFDARFLVDGVQGLTLDLRDPGAPDPVFAIRFQPGAQGDAVTLSWDPAGLPEGDWRMRDAQGGALGIDLDMSAQGQLMVTDSAIDRVIVSAGAASAATVTATYGPGWNMASLPVLPAVADRDSLFPGVISAFRFGGGYELVDVLEPCAGYWLHFSMGGAYEITGEAVDTCGVSLPAGWSMVGVPIGGVYVSDITTQPPGSIVSIFAFAGGYQQHQGQDLLPEGEAFWFNLATIAVVTLPSAAGR